MLRLKHLLIKLNGFKKFALLTLKTNQLIKQPNNKNLTSNSIQNP